MSDTPRYTDELGNVVEREIADAWDYLQSLDRRYPPKPNPERDARFEKVMQARRVAARPPEPAARPRRRRP